MPRSVPPSGAELTSFHSLPSSADNTKRSILFASRRCPGRRHSQTKELLAEGLTGSRWWTLEELKDSTNERFAPRCFPASTNRW